MVCEETALPRRFMSGYTGWAMGTMDRAENLDRAIDVQDRDQEAQTRFRRERSTVTRAARTSVCDCSRHPFGQESGLLRPGDEARDGLRGAFTLLVITAPVCAVITVAIFLTMGKPVFFKQWRVGKGGKPFEVLKFRTMRPDRRVEAKPIDVVNDRRRTHSTRRIRG